MTTHSATLQDSGAQPLFELEVGTTTYCRFQLLARAPGTNNWVELMQGNNKSRNTATFSLITSPFPGDVKSLDEWEIGWTATFFGYSNNSSEPYELQVAVTQNGRDTMQPHDREQGSFDAPTKTLDGVCTLHL